MKSRTAIQIYLHIKCPAHYQRKIPRLFYNIPYIFKNISSLCFQQIIGILEVFYSIIIECRRGSTFILINLYIFHHMWLEFVEQLIFQNESTCGNWDAISGLLCSRIIYRKTDALRYGLTYVQHGVSCY